MHNTTGCRLCPRACGAQRQHSAGLCGERGTPRVARIAPHYWEEPCISGVRGSGAVFFSGCPLRCAFCQNRAISQGGLGREMGEQALARAFLGLQQQGVHNLNLISAGHFRPAVQRALARAGAMGLSLPVVWNTGGYETPAAVRALAGDVDVWLADLKFHSPALSASLAGAADYFAVASAAITEMQRLAGPPRFDEEGLMRRGVLVRILVLPGQRQDAKRLLHWLHSALPPGGFWLSLMRQYTPPEGVPLPGPFNRRLASYEYRDVCDTALALGLSDTYTQQRESAHAHYTPPFDFTGVPP